MPEPSAAQSSTPALAVDGLTCSYDDHVVLHDVDLHLGDGRLLAVLGPSGCGKTTLLRAVAGLHRPDAGFIRIAGRVVDGPNLQGAALRGRRTHVRPDKRGVGLVFQHGALFEHLTVAGNVGFGVPRPDRADQIERMLDLIGMASFADAMPFELSGGQQQRVAIARALAPSPALVLLDEPFSSLDAQLRRDIRRDVRALLRETGSTAVIVTHDQEEALSLADEVAVMMNGRVVQQGTPDTVYQRPANDDVARFVGDVDQLTVDSTAGTVASTIIGPVSFRPTGETPSHLLVRPEDLRIGTPPAGRPSAAVRVRDVEYFGHDQLITVETDGTQIRVRTGPDVRLSPGDTSNVWFCAEGLAVVDRRHASTVA